MASTRSKTTVRKNVISSTAASLLGEVFTTSVNSLHSLMLYATMNRMAAMAGMGIRAA